MKYKHPRYFTAILVAALHATAFAKPICYENKDTNAYTCYESTSVKEAANHIRFAKMLQGGPLGVEPTGYLIAANCETGMVHLKDKQGVSFGGGHRSSTYVLDHLVGSLCTEPIRKK